MKLKFHPSALLYNLMVTLLIFTILSPINAVAAGVVSAGLFCAGFVPASPLSGVLRDEVISRVYTRDLQEVLFPKNDFYQTAMKDQDIALDAEQVEVPQDENGATQVIVNPKEFPLKTFTEQDSKLVYNVDLLATPVQQITDLNESLTSYEKRQAKLRKHRNSLNTQIANRILHSWGPTKNEMVRQTTGSQTRAAHAPGASGQRKRVAKDDIMWAMSQFDHLDVPEEGRFLVIPSYMYQDLFYIDDFINSDKLRMQGNLMAGQVGEIMGFRVFKRSRTLVYTEDTNPQKKAIGTVNDADDNQAAVFFHEDFVRYAEGRSKVFIDPERGDHLGMTMNAAVRGGGTFNRNDQVGVLALVEDHA